MNKMIKGIMLALATVALVSTLIGNIAISVPTGPDNEVCEIRSKYAGKIDTTQGSSWRTMTRTRLVFASGLSEEVYFDLTITLSGEFLIFAKPGAPATPPPESIEVRIAICRLDITEWVFYDLAKPSRVVMLTEEPDATGKNWESRSFTFVYKGLIAPYRGDIGLQEFRVHVRWRLYPASSPLYEAQVRHRSLVVTRTQG